MKEFTEITLQKIEDYLLDRLNVTERTLFETELATDANLREELEKTKRVQEAAVRSKLRNKIKDIQTAKLAEWKTEKTEQPKIVDKPRRNTWRIPTTFAAAASVLFTFYLATSPVSLPDADTISERGNSTMDSVQIAILTKYGNAVTALKNEDFETAAILFDEVAANQNIRPYYPEAATWYGIISKIETAPDTAKKQLDLFSKRELKEFKISRLERAKVWVKLRLSRWF